MVRVRYAPSPTGYLHVGGARTALYNYLYARQKGGQFILRVEDTDVARSTEASLRMVMEDLIWLGLSWDEGPDPVTLEDKGSYGPYKQSARRHIYMEYAQKLLEQGKAYYCFMTDEEIEAQKQEALRQGLHTHVQSPYESWSLEQAKAKLAQGTKAAIRFKTRGLAHEYILQDLVRGEVRFPSDMIGDFVLLRSDGMPVYNFCCVIDDALMKITHVFRAEEHLSNTLRQLMIFEALGFKPPEFGHLSLVLDENRQKLSKRHGATSCHEFKNEGFLPEALNNFNALLGWSHPEEKEILSRDELIKSFSVDRLHMSGAVFDIKKLRWMNATHLRDLPTEELWNRVQPFIEGMNLPSVASSWVAQALGLFKTSMETLVDAKNFFRFVVNKYEMPKSPELTEVLAWPTTAKVFQLWAKNVESVAGEFLTEAEFQSIQQIIKTESGANGKSLFQALRVAVIGIPHGPELKFLVPLIRKEELLARVQQLT